MRYLSTAILLGLLFIAILPAAEIPMQPYESGIASWYDSDPDGPRTANGERFDPEALKAAHKSLPFGTIVRVHDLNNGMSVEVMINDRGPYVDGRIIDLTPAAARAIDMYERGISPVELHILHTPRVPVSQYNRPGDTGWYRIQVGTYANTATVSRLYTKFHELGLRPVVEIVPGDLLRITLRWIPEHDRDTTMRILEGLGINDVLIRGEVDPFL